MYGGMFGTSKTEQKIVGSCVMLLRIVVDQLQQHCKTKNIKQFAVMQVDFGKKMKTQ